MLLSRISDLLSACTCASAIGNLFSIYFGDNIFFVSWVNLFCGRFSITGGIVGVFGGNGFLRSLSILVLWYPNENITLLKALISHCLTLRSSTADASSFLFWFFVLAEFLKSSINAVKMDGAV